MGLLPALTSIGTLTMVPRVGEEALKRNVVLTCLLFTNSMSYYLASVRCRVYLRRVSGRRERDEGEGLVVFGQSHESLGSDGSVTAGHKTPGHSLRGGREKVQNRCFNTPQKNFNVRGQHGLSRSRSLSFRFYCRRHFRNCRLKARPATLCC